MIYFYNIKLRYISIISLILISFIILFIKLIYIETIEYIKLKQEDNNISTKKIIIQAYRGIILDRNNNPLAINVPADTIWADPLYVCGNDHNLNKIFNILKLSNKTRKKIKNKIDLKAKKSGFIYIKRKVDIDISKKIKNLNINGIYIIHELKRYYPMGEITSHIIGFTNIDEIGQEGLELEFNKFLSGKNGYFKYKENLHNEVVFDKKNRYVKAINGNNLQISIDSRLQYITYKYLKKAVIQTNAESGSAIIEDVHTGEILAIVNYPSYDPNNIEAYSSNERNRAITDVYELGSVMKIFAAATILTYGNHINTECPIINTHPGFYYIGKNIIRDERDYGFLNLRHILVKSSNVGISKMILKLTKPNLLQNTLKSFGFGEKTGINFPGERNGYIPSLKNKYRKFQLATLSFGYGVNATDLQLVNSISIIANNGKFIKPTILKRKINKKGKIKYIISKKNSKKIISIMQSVVEDHNGTASKAQIPLYHVGGKTGTAKIFSKGNYNYKYLASFIGIAPITNPKLAIVITIKDPKGNKYGGGYVSAPVFAKIALKSLQILKIKPDKITK